MTRRAIGSGAAWYEATRLDGQALSLLLTAVLREAGVGPAIQLPPGVEAVSRYGHGFEFRFILNHTDAAVSVPGSGINLVTGHEIDGFVDVPAGGVAVLQVDG